MQHHLIYKSGFRHSTATDQAELQHASPFDLALDTGTCKASEARLSGVSHVRMQITLSEPRSDQHTFEDLRLIARALIRVQSMIHVACLHAQAASSIRYNLNEVSMPARQVSKCPRKRAFAGLWSDMIDVRPRRTPETGRAPSKATNLVEGNDAVSDRLCKAHTRAWRRHMLGELTRYGTAKRSGEAA